MAEDKAEEALNEADNITLKAYYSGETPYESGSIELDKGIMGEEHVPWLFKWIGANGSCKQFADTGRLYEVFHYGIETILDAALVNNKQKEAVCKLVNKLLVDELLEDRASEGNPVVY